MISTMEYHLQKLKMMNLPHNCADFRKMQPASIRKAGVFFLIYKSLNAAESLESEIILGIPDSEQNTHKN